MMGRNGSTTTLSLRRRTFLRASRKSERREYFPVSERGRVKAHDLALHLSNCRRDEITPLFVLSLSSMRHNVRLRLSHGSSSSRP